MDEFCDSEFWNWNTTWTTNNPDFTPCFQKTVLVWIPSMILLLGTPLEIYYAYNSAFCNIPWNLLNTGRLCVSAALVALTAVDLLISREAIDIISLTIKFLTFILAAFMGLLNKSRGIVSSGVQFVFWLTLSVLAIPELRAEIRTISSNDNANEPKWKSIMYIIYFILVSLQAVAHCFADRTPISACYNDVCKPVTMNAELQSSFLRKIFFAWFEPLAWKGYRKPLSDIHLDELDTDHSSHVLAAKFRRGWQNSLRNVTDETEQRPSPTSYDFATVLSRERKTPISIIPTIVREFSGPLWFSGALKLVMELLSFSRPYILGLLIRFTSSNEPLWHGVFYMLLLFFVTILMGLLNGQFYQKSFLMGFRVKSALIGAIYRKSLTISMAAHSDITSGQIVNLMSVDAQRFFEIAAFLHVIWTAPIVTCVAIYFLWQILGVSALVGLLIFVLLIPINSFVSTKVKRCQAQRMKVADERIKMINEIINGIKVLKMYAWEPSFAKYVNEIREQELRVIKHSSMISICNMISTTMAPYIVTLATFATFVLIDEKNVITPEIAFVSLTLFNIMRQPIIFFPMAILQVMQSWVGIKRINTFLNKDDIVKDNVMHEDIGNIAIRIDNGAFAWYDGQAKVKQINMKIEKRSLVAVVGTVGSGKSTLLSSILGETQKLSGLVNTFGRVAYVSQQAWILNATLKQNIIFGNPFNQLFYDQVLDACALRPDIKFLPAGDETEIGERGINLSGGQKQRVAFARALYSWSDIYLLDDPLSAVDTHVGRHIFENIIGPNGLLKNKTRLLVTHSIVFLPQVSTVYVVNDGTITESGTFKELIVRKGFYANFIENYIQEMESVDEVAAIKKIIKSLSDEETDESGAMSVTINESKQTKNKVPSPLTKTKPKANCGALIEKEKSQIGSVDVGVYARYFQSVGIVFTTILLLTSILSQSFSVYGNIWLAEWSADAESGSPHVRDMYLGVYGGLGILQAVVTVIMYFVLIFGCLNASRDIHNNLLDQTLSLPISFFETTPQGRIINKFSKDINMIDSVVPLSIKLLIGTLFSVISLLIVISMSTPKFMFVIIPIGLMYFAIQSFYVATSRQLRRIMSMARSPVYSHVCETLSGLTTIRAFKAQERFIEESDKRVDFNQKCTYPAMVGNRWLALRLEIIGSLVVFFASLFAVLGRDTLTGATVGLSISYALQVTSSLNFLTRNSSDMEMNIVANERLEEYNAVKKEAESNETAEDPNWPAKGSIKFEDYQVRYRDSLGLVLNGISFTINECEKIGIVGRTGAGKSSLALGLFRILEASGGRIFIDDVDISKLNLHYLRSRLTIIPQDPVMFSGTLRLNVDPLKANGDDVLWTALEQSSLKEFVQSLPDGLDTIISEGGANLSVGQRQLICLARALLRKTKILVLDEATASLDMETNDLVQKTTRLQFRDCTVLTIAHRLATIMDSDRVLVLDKGTVVEFDEPEILLRNETGIFCGMVQNEGLGIKV